MRVVEHHILWSQKPPPSLKVELGLRPTPLRRPPPRTLPPPGKTSGSTHRSLQTLNHALLFQTWIAPSRHRRLSLLPGVQGT